MNHRSSCLLSNAHLYATAERTTQVQLYVLNLLKWPIVHRPLLLRGLMYWTKVEMYTDTFGATQKSSSRIRFSIEILLSYVEVGNGGTFTKKKQKVKNVWEHEKKLRKNCYRTNATVEQFSKIVTQIRVKPDTDEVDRLSLRSRRILRGGQRHFGTSATGNMAGLWLRIFT